MYLSGLRSCQCRLGTAKITLFSTNSEPRFIRILFFCLARTPESYNERIKSQLPTDLRFNSHLAKLKENSSREGGKGEIQEEKTPPAPKCPFQ